MIAENINDFFLLKKAAQHLDMTWRKIGVATQCPEIHHVAGKKKSVTGVVFEEFVEFFGMRPECTQVHVRDENRPIMRHALFIKKENANARVTKISYNAKRRTCLLPPRRTLGFLAQADKYPLAKPAISRYLARQPR